MGCESQPPDIYRYNDGPEQRLRTSRIPCAAPQAERKLESGFQSSRTPRKAFPRVDPKVARGCLRRRPRALRALRRGRRHLLLSSSCATSSGPAAQESVFDSGRFLPILGRNRTGTIMLSIRCRPAAARWQRGPTLQNGQSSATSVLRQNDPHALAKRWSQTKTRESPVKWWTFAPPSHLLPQLSEAELGRI